MKKFIEKIMAAFKRTVTGFRQVPIAVFIILSTVCNYVFGQTNAKINELYSNITYYKDRDEFIIILLKLIAWWLIIQLLTQLIGKIYKHRILNINYMKWITKLTNSKLSSISSISTGKASSAINEIAKCDKGIVDNIANIIPNLVPFVILCKKEYDEAGILPVCINVIVIISFIIFNIFMAKSKSYQKAEEARAEISSVTIDCIKNSQTVKYFGKEIWSINRQEKAQNDTYYDQLALGANTIVSVFNTVMWIPTAAAAYLCWQNINTVLYVVMMSYVIDNIGACIGTAMQFYTIKINNLKILGRLEPDDSVKVPIDKSLIIKNTEFCYDSKKKDAVIFKIDELEIKRAHRYCVTGRSGFGKSTLAKLITGTNAPTKGYIPVVDSVYMFAESELFNCSVAENITLGEEYDKKEILDMLKKFSVSVDLDIWKENVGENGNKLSTGQKQRINLCRTLFYARRHPGSLIVMDEVTAALDIKTSLECLLYLTEEFKRLEVTLLYISNKTDYLETELITDNIYVNRTGNVVTYDSEDKN